MVAKEEKRAARTIEQGTGLVDLRHFHLRYRWSIRSDADQLAVWGGQDATPSAAATTGLVYVRVSYHAWLLERELEKPRSEEKSL